MNELRTEHVTAWWKQKRWTLRFGLRSLLVVTVLAAVVLGLWANSAHQQRRAVAHFENLGGMVQLTPLPSWASGRWIASWLDPHWFCTADSLRMPQLPQPSPPDVMQPLTHLPRLRELTFFQGPIRNDDLAYVAALRHLEALELFNYGTMSTPAELGIDATRFGADPDWPQYYHAVTDEGLRHLSGLHRLRRLAILYAPITDEGLQHLKHLRLDSAEFGGTHITPEGLKLLATVPAAQDVPP